VRAAHEESKKKRYKLSNSYNFDVGIARDVLLKGGEKGAVLDEAAIRELVGEAKDEGIERAHCRHILIIHRD